MASRKLCLTGLLVAMSILAAAGAFCLDYFVLSAPVENNTSLSVQGLLPSITSSERLALVFDEPDVDLGSARKKISHRFTYRNASAMPLTITNVRPSCRCAVSEPDRTTLQPEEYGSITLEADVSQKEPGAHRFLLFVDYECGERKATATASLRLVFQPDLYITPRNFDINVTEGTRTIANVSVIDYRKEPLKILKVRPSSSAIEAKISESPSEYLPGWRYIIEATYTDPPAETRWQFSEQILIETSDSELSLMTVPIDVHRLQRLRVAPQAVTLQPGHPAEVILRDSLGQKVVVEKCDTAGLVELSFTKEGDPTKRVLLSLPGGWVDPSKYPATIWIRVSKPCERRFPIRVSLAAPTRS